VVEGGGRESEREGKYCILLTFASDNDDSWLYAAMNLQRHSRRRPGGSRRGGGRGGEGGMSHTLLYHKISRKTIRMEGQINSDKRRGQGDR
jgi:hypothetical protein